MLAVADDGLTTRAGEQQVQDDIPGQRDEEPGQVKTGMRADAGLAGLEPRVIPDLLQSLAARRLYLP